MDFVIVLVILAALVAFVSAPLRASGSHRGSAADVPDGSSNGWLRSARLEELRAARDAKYREIRDADLDHRTGKLSDEDWSAVDTSLRAEAIEILHAIDTIGER